MLGRKKWGWMVSGKNWMERMIGYLDEALNWVLRNKVCREKVAKEENYKKSRMKAEDPLQS